MKGYSSTQASSEQAALRADSHQLSRPLSPVFEHTDSGCIGFPCISREYPFFQPLLLPLTVWVHLQETPAPYSLHTHIYIQVTKFFMPCSKGNKSLLWREQSSQVPQLLNRTALEEPERATQERP